MTVRDLIRQLMDNADLNDEVTLEILVDGRYYQGNVTDVLVTEKDKLVLTGNVVGIERI